ncbi:hypothetical protein LY78DRAFT_663633 [Colletotrichum sublineola]|nr:hypothetical protein LY78DRAFT_663633 [Colletotrichum sublineola]
MASRSGVIVPLIFLFPSVLPMYVRFPLTSTCGAATDTLRARSHPVPFQMPTRIPPRARILHWGSCLAKFCDGPSTDR